MPLFNGISSVNLNSIFHLIDSDMGLSTNVRFSVYKFKMTLFTWEQTMGFIRYRWGESCKIYGRNIWSSTYIF